MASSVEDAKLVAKIGYAMAFFVGVAGGGAAVLVVLQLIGPFIRLLPEAVVLGGATMGGLLLLAHTAFLPDRRLWQGRFLIPQSRFRFGTTPGLFVFGAELGSVYRTVIPNDAVYVLGLTAVVAPFSPVGVGLAAVGWAAGRGVPVMVAAFKPRLYGRWWPTDESLRRRAAVAAVLLSCAFMFAVIHPS